MIKKENAAAEGFGGGASVCDQLGGDHPTNNPDPIWSQVERAPHPARVLPRPLVPQDVDLSKLPAMLLDIENVRNSKWFLRASHRPRIAYCMLNLLMRAFRERPAASIEADEDVLMDAARCPEAEWAEVRAIVLKDWVLCSDGRYYSPMVAEMALAAHAREIDYAFERETNRKRKADHRAGIKATDQTPPEFGPWLAAKFPGALPYLADLARVAPKSLRDKLVLSFGQATSSTGHGGDVTGMSAGDPAENALKHKHESEHESEHEREHESERSCSDMPNIARATPLLGSLTGPDKGAARSTNTALTPEQAREVALSVFASQSMEESHG